MSMTVIWTGMVTLAVLFGLATGRGPEVAAAAVEGAASAGLQPVWYTGAHAPHWSSFSAPPPAVPHLALAHWQDLPALLAGAEAPCPA